MAYWNLVLSGRFKFLDLWNRFLLVSPRVGDADGLSPEVHLHSGVGVGQKTARSHRHGRVIQVCSPALVACRSTTNDPSPRTRGTYCWTLET